MDPLKQMETEQAAKELIAKVYPPELVESQFSVLLERKRKTAMKTAEAVMIILKEMTSGPSATQ